MKNEFIICAAVNYDGTIVCGRRHGDCYRTAESLLKICTCWRKHQNTMPQFADRENQGFMTSTGRYVTRVEAFTIAKANNQIIHKMFDNDSEGSLTSEDLY